MSYTANEMITYCSWEKSQTCKNKHVKCDLCNQEHGRQGLVIFADNRIKNYYVADPVLVKRLKKRMV